MIPEEGMSVVLTMMIKPVHVAVWLLLAGQKTKKNQNKKKVQKIRKLRNFFVPTLHIIVEGCFLF